jgi:translation initiation factor 3 subunit H
VSASTRTKIFFITYSKVTSKIIKHSLDSSSSNAHGLLLGLDLDGILEISNSFPLPNQTSDEDDKSMKSVGNDVPDIVENNIFDSSLLARYQGQMLRSLKEVGSADNIVGFYQSTTLGAFLKQPLVESQAIHQEKLRHGGIVIIHGKSSDNSCMIPRAQFRNTLIDISRTARGNASFKAFRLTKAFVDAYRRNNFSTAR